MWGVLAFIRKRQFTPVTCIAPGIPRVFRQQPRRQVHSLDVPESEPRQRVQSVAAAAKQLHHVCFPRPLAYSEPAQASREFPDLLFRRPKPQVRCFPPLPSPLVPTYPPLNPPASYSPF